MRHIVDPKLAMLAFGFGERREANLKHIADAMLNEWAQYQWMTYKCTYLYIICM